MIQKLTPYIIGIQIFIGLFHAGIGIEEWRYVGIYDIQTLYLLVLGLGTFIVYLRLKKLPIEARSFKMIFEHVIFLGMITWLFYTPWGDGWEIFMVSFISICLGLVLMLAILESQFQQTFGGGNWGIPEYFWKIGGLLTLINSITIPIIFILLHESLSIIWVFYGINWLFLWKEDFSGTAL